MHVSLTFRSTIAVVLVMAGGLKAIKPATHEESLLESIVNRFRPIVRLAIRALPLLEILLAAWLLTGRYAIYALAASCSLLLLFSAVIVAAIKKRFMGSCSCFGNTSGRLDRSNLWFNALLIGSAVAAMWMETFNGGTLSIISGSMEDYFAIGLTTICFFGVKAITHEIETLNRTLKNQSSNLL